MTEGQPRRHFVIPDTQVRPGVPLDHIDWIAKAIVHYRPDVVVHLGDHWDHHSLNGHEQPGSAPLEGARYIDDLTSGNEAFARLCKPMEDEIKRREEKHRPRWKPRKVFITGNHEIRADRVAENNPKFLGTIGSDLCDIRDWERHPFLKVVDIDGILYCMAPHHKILTSDLRWIPLGDVEVGQEIIAFDEQSPGPRRGRTFRTANVLRKEIAEAELFDVRLSDGKVFTVTADHQWLCRKSSSTGLDWCRTDELTTWHETPRLFNEWERGNRFEDGWFGVVLEGEGHLSKPNCKQGGIQVGLAQRPGSVLTRAQKYLTDNHFDFKTWMQGNGCASIRVLGPSSKKPELMATVGAERLIKKLKAEMLGRVQLPDGVSPSRIVSVKSVGAGKIAKVQTTTGTMIVDGYPHHNCHYFQSSHSARPIGGSIPNKLTKIGASFVHGHQQGLDMGTKMMGNGKTWWGIQAGSCYTHIESYRGAQGQRHWRGVIVLNEVANGEHCPMPLSLDYLCRKYEGMSLQAFHRLKYPGMNWDHLA